MFIGVSYLEVVEVGSAVQSSELFLARGTGDVVEGQQPGLFSRLHAPLILNHGR